VVLGGRGTSGLLRRGPLHGAQRGGSSRGSFEARPGPERPCLCFFFPFCTENASKCGGFSKTACALFGDNGSDKANHPSNDLLATKKKERKKEQRVKRKADAAAAAGDGGAKEKRLNTFLVFSQKKREEVKAKFPGVSARVLQEHLGKMWQTLSVSDRAAFKAD